MDFKTIYVALTLVSITALFISFNIAALLRPIRGATYWYSTLLFMASGSVLISLRGMLPNALSVHLANALLIYAPALMIISFCKLRGAKTAGVIPLVLATAGSIGYSIAAEYYGMRGRLTMAAISSATILSFGVWQLTVRRGVIGVNAMLIFWSLLMIGMGIARAIITLGSKIVGENYVVENSFHAFYLLALLTSTFGFSSAFIVEAFHTINRQLEKERERLSESDHFKEMVLRVISHDLRAPLGTMAQLLDITQEKIRDKDIPLSRESLERTIMNLQKQTQQSYHLVEDLLVWSRSHSGQVSPAHKQANLRRTSTEVFEYHAIPAMEKGVKLEFGNELPDVHISVEPAGLSMVLRNTVSNAIKFSPKGGKVRLSAEIRDPNLVVAVSDEGTGASEGVWDRILHGQVVTPAIGTAGESGSGIGLLMCRQWVEAHGGRLAFKRDAETGTRVEILLPLQMQ